jgi:RNA polymerase sigma-70 factor (ECF subfamily)
MQDETREQALERDRELFLRLKQDPAAVGELYDRYADRLYGFLLKRCGHKETAEDLVSHTFVRLLESLPTLEWKNAPLSAWLYQVASNALIDHYRRASTKRDTDLDTDGWDPPGNDDPAWNTELKIEGEALRLAMQDLSPRDQQVLDLRFFAGLETVEVADQLGITANHAAVLVYRAIGRLRQKATVKETKQV